MKKNEKAKSNLILYVIIGVLSVLLVIALCIIIFKDNGKVKKKTKPVEDKTKENLQKIAAPGEEFEIFEANSYPMYQVIQINGKEVNYQTTYYSVIINNVYKLDDNAYIIALSAIYNDQMEAYDDILYAVDKEGNVIWFTSDKNQCQAIGSNLCIGLDGVSSSSFFGYFEFPYKIENNKLSMVTSVYHQDPIWAACKLDGDSIFAAEYEIDYKGKGKFSDVKTKQSITASEYLQQRRDNGDAVDCSVFD